MTMRARYRLLGARLGLLAFALIILAPLFSQLRADTSNWSWLGELACHDDTGQPRHTTPNSLHASVFDACGYCSLLINSPALSSQGAWLPIPATWASLAVAPLLPGPHCNPRYPAAHSRAPPALA
ncbi:DUF2946 domain-containing protein [Pseudomonas sp. LRF_L74]|uniref:DUF2946 domain-containing protein n=1 Tax=Pseudomonas sp. LRF_L74 TaxID=3369422 RepID=UPI003F609D89